MAPIHIIREPSVTTTDDQTALLIIDVQEGLDEPRLGARNNPAAECNMARLLAEWRARKRPIFHVQHMSAEPDSPLRPELPGNAIKREVAPIGDEPVIQKNRQRRLHRHRPCASGCRKQVSSRWSSSA